ncbi:DoxX family membrane protein [Sphingomonas sp. LB-2]|uniref:DoxX family membrane protein n=1 Tax=Sphingomonas caeni TaxID=2984949 RepID=UPI0022313A84|nr:DoxX family membrane protein [Sphingomonas caeni]MCW3849582.1 DoxX family membrane protein [Sphingomonas caeni]
MTIRDQIDRDALPYALGAIGLGIASLIARDFAFQWQPVPQTIPARDLLALASGALLAAGGLAAAWRGAGLARLILPAFYLLWVIALHLPVVAAAPTVGNLLGVAEILALAAGGSVLADERGPKWLPLAARIAFGLSALVFGLSHFVYADFTAKMVPGWIPLPLFWAYATGAGHAAAGLAILSGVKARLAAAALAGMCASFVLLLHLPRVIAAPDSRFEWTMLCVSLSITGAAWLLRRILPR